MSEPNSIQEDGHWRWFASPLWHHASAMYQESHLSSFALHEFGRYHHLRACIYFCTAALEAFWNEKMRAHLEKSGKTDEEIWSVLRKGRILDKIEKWPEIIGAEIVSLPPYIMGHINYMLDVRNEITHPKNKDHSIYKDLDTINPFWCVKSAAEYMVVVHESLKEPYPYWLLGWNMVGLNHECQAFPPNAQTFLWSLKFMGFKNIPAGDYYQVKNWEQEHLMTLKAFQKLWKYLDVNAPDIEPRDPNFPQKPRLTRRWWDVQLIKGR